MYRNNKVNETVNACEKNGGSVILILINLNINYGNIVSVKNSKIVFGKC